jgi:hypothetical protein
MAFTLISGARPSLSPTQRAGPLTTRQASRDATDRSVASPTGLLTLGFDPARFQTEPPACYRASWQLPGPDSHRQATTSLSLDPAGITSNWLGARKAEARWAGPAGRRSPGARRRPVKDGVYDMNGQRCAWLRDPEGNLLAVAERPDDSSPDRGPLHADPEHIGDASIAGSWAASSAAPGTSRTRSTIGSSCRLAIRSGVRGFSHRHAAD